MPVAATAERTVLRDLIDERGIRYSFLAEKLGLTPSHFTRLMTRERPITSKNIAALEELLNVEATVFFDGHDLRVSKVSSVEEHSTQVPPVAEAEGRQG